MGCVIKGGEDIQIIANNTKCDEIHKTIDWCTCPDNSKWGETNIGTCNFDFWGISGPQAALSGLIRPYPAISGPIRPLSGLIKTLFRMTRAYLGLNRASMIDCLRALFRAK